MASETITIMARPLVRSALHPVVVWRDPGLAEIYAGIKNGNPDSLKFLSEFSVALDPFLEEPSEPPI